MIPLELRYTSTLIDLLVYTVNRRAEKRVPDTELLFQPGNSSHIILL